MNTISLQKNSNIVLIDCSYYIFHRYFATYRWFSFQKINIPIDEIVYNDIFINAFYKHINNDIKKICKMWKTKVSNIILCNDCLRCDIWRNDIYDKYKATRVQKTNFNKKIFTIFEDYVKELGIQNISSERLEGDDIIYLSHKYIKNNLYDNNNIIIITNDNDFLQLIDKNVLIYNMQFKELKTRGFEDPKVDLLFKVIYGDRSDNISKIGSCITKENALVLSKMYPNDRLKYIKENDLEEKFNLNMKLVSFENIPDIYINNFNKNIKIIIN
jgi:5'-3' exonuclease